MIRLCELMGLSQADLTDVMSFVLGIHIAGVFAGNVLFWAVKEFFSLSEKLIDSFFNWIFKCIRKIRGKGKE